MFRPGGAVFKAPTTNDDMIFLTPQPVQLMSCSLEIARAGRFSGGVTEIPFEAPVTPLLNRVLYESYHGVFINVQYLLKVVLKRNFLNKDVHKSLEFVVENRVGVRKDETGRATRSNLSHLLPRRLATVRCGVNCVYVSRGLLQLRRHTCTVTIIKPCPDQPAGTISKIVKTWVWAMLHFKG